MLKWIMLSLYILFIGYILWRGIHCLRRTHPIFKKKSVLAILIVVFLACCATLLLGAFYPDQQIKVAFHKFSNFWLGVFIYLLFFILVADILNLIAMVINHFHPLKFLESKKKYPIVAVLVVVLSFGLASYGSYHMDDLHTNTYEVSVDKKCGNIKQLNVVLISDFHLGYSIGCKQMKDMVSKVNALNPDLIVIAGDIVDNDMEALDNEEELEKILSSMKSKYGTYAVYGNHDVDETLVGGFSISPKTEAFRDPELENFVKKCGFKILEDKTVLIDDSFYLVGRLDGEKAGDGTTNRKSMKELTKGIDKSKPLLVLNHEPVEFEEYTEVGTDLFLCGHTHAGQFFPLTIGQSLVWENMWGYKKFGTMHNFVTSGVGIYGPAMRVLTDSEVMQIKVDFE